MLDRADTPFEMLPDKTCHGTANELSHVQPNIMSWLIFQALQVAMDGKSSSDGRTCIFNSGRLL